MLSCLVGVKPSKFVLFTAGDDPGSTFRMPVIKKIGGATHSTFLRRLLTYEPQGD